MKNKKIDMCQGPLFSKIIVYTIPIILTSLLQLLFNAADLVVVGRFRGSTSVAAVGATGALIALITNLFIGLSVGAGVTVAHGIGADDDEHVHQTVHTAIPAAFISGLLLTVVGVIFSEHFLTLMGTPDEILKLSSLYMKIYFTGMTASMLYNFGSAILRAAGDTKGPLIYLSVAGILNVVLNVFFVIVFKMNVEGVAIATVISQFLSAFLVVRALMRRTDSCRFDLRKMRFHKVPLTNIVRVGLPAGIQGSIFSISNVIIQSSINSFGAVVMSGNAAAGNIEGFVYVAMNAFHQTALNFTGQNFGARKFKRINRIALYCLLSVFTVGSVVGISAFLASHPLLSIYITDSAEAIEYGILRMTYVCLPYALCGMMDVMTGLMRGMGSSLAPMLITVLGVCGIRIGWIFTIFRIPAYHTLNSLYVSYPISWGVTFAVQIICFIILCKLRDMKYGKGVDD